MKKLQILLLVSCTYMASSYAAVHYSTKGPRGPEVTEEKELYTPTGHFEKVVRRKYWPTEPHVYYESRQNINDSDEKIYLVASIGWSNDYEAQKGRLYPDKVVADLPRISDQAEAQEAFNTLEQKFNEGSRKAEAGEAGYTLYITKEIK